MSKLERLIDRLEEGREFCGHCGKDITDAPDCIHRHHSAASYSSSDDKFVHNKGVLIQLRSIRVTEVYLMYPDELQALPLFDPVLISNTMSVKDLFRINQVIEAKGHTPPVYVHRFNQCHSSLDGYTANISEHLLNSSNNRG